MRAGGWSVLAEPPPACPALKVVDALGRERQVRLPPGQGWAAAPTFCRPFREPRGPLAHAPLPPSEQPPAQRGPHIPEHRRVRRDACTARGNIRCTRIAQPCPVTATVTCKFRQRPHSAPPAHCTATRRQRPALRPTWPTGVPGAAPDALDTCEASGAPLRAARPPGLPSKRRILSLFPAPLPFAFPLVVHF